MQTHQQLSYRTKIDRACRLNRITLTAIIPSSRAHVHGDRNSHPGCMSSDELTRPYLLDDDSEPDLDPLDDPPTAWADPELLNDD